MIYVLADNIISPLADTSEGNCQSILSGFSSLCRYEHLWHLPHPVTASLFTPDQQKSQVVQGMTRFESLAIRSIRQAVSQTDIDIASSRVIFILSTTKGNVESLASHPSPLISSYPIAHSLHRIANHIGITTRPIAVCNACISGVSALMLALRLLESQQYDYAIVCGADVQSPFTISGFQSLQALSAEACRPFDIERIGLNLGEAAATMVLASSATPEASRQTNPLWSITCSAVRNDAFHISSPSRDGEGACLALSTVLPYAEVDDIAFINAHGTATMYNDQMESIAIQRSGLGHIPVSSLKGYLGHTLGAAGLLETILSMHAIDHHQIPATRGFSEIGVSGKISITTTTEATQKQSFIKMISGFGGGNAVLVATHRLFHLQFDNPFHLQFDNFHFSLRTVHSVSITPTQASTNGVQLPCTATGPSLLTQLYKQYVGNYPKFYKMDALSRLGFTATELLLMSDSPHRDYPPESTAIILFNHSSSVVTDLQYQETIQDAANYFPSPSTFVYTLPNIVTAEIAIRHGFRGETSFYILGERDDNTIGSIIEASFADPATRRMISGWIDYQDDAHFDANLFLLEKQLET